MTCWQWQQKRASLELRVSPKVGTSWVCWVEPGPVPHALLVPGFSSAAGLCRQEACRTSAVSFRWLCRVARCICPVGSSRGGTSCCPVLCSPPETKDSVNSPPPRFAGGAVPCTPEHPPVLFNAGPYRDVPCVWVGAVGKVDAKGGAAAQVRFRPA